MKNSKNCSAYDCDVMKLPSAPYCFNHWAMLKDKLKGRIERAQKANDMTTLYGLIALANEYIDKEGDYVNS